METSIGVASTRTATSIDPSLMVTGHRHGVDLVVVTPVLRTVLDRMSRRLPGIMAISGMALGVDLAFAEAALDLGIPLVAALPLPEQNVRWQRREALRWERVVGRAARVVEVWREVGYETHTPVARLLRRNEWMLDHSTEIVAAWDGRPTGGTAHAIEGAKRRGRAVLVVDARTGGLSLVRPG